MKINSSLFAAPLLIGLSLLSTPASATTNLVTNGDFENNGLTSWTQNGWGTNINGVISGAFSASTGCVGDGCIHSGNSFNLTSGAFLFQDLATVAGATYTLSFDFGAAGFANELVALFGNSTAFDGVNLPSTNANYTVSGLVATGTTTRLLFLGRQDPSFNRLDNVSVVQTAVNGSVPEPATWAMMLLGFGIVGFAMRKRSNVRTTVSYA